MKLRSVLVTTLVLLGGTAFSQEIAAANAPKSAEKAELAPTEQLARSILDTAQAEAKAAEPMTRSYLCFLTARGMMKYDRPKAQDLLYGCFDDALQVPDSDPDMRDQLQSMVVQELIAFGPSAVEGLLPRATGNAKSRIRATLIRHYTTKKEIDKAVALVDGIRPEEEEFPYGAVAQMMVSLSGDETGTRTGLFGRALADYAKRPKDVDSFNSEDLATLVIRFYRSVPKNMALEAVDEVLKHAQPDSTHRPRHTIHLRNSNANASFASVYEVRLFQMLPVLRELDHAKADDLLQKHSEIQPQIKEFPDGMRSLEPTYRDTPPTENEKSNLSISMRSGNPQGMSDEDLIRANKLAGEIIKSAPDSPRQAIAQAVSMPTGSERLRTARARALEGIARSLQKSSPMFAKSALDELGKAAAGLGYINAQDYLFSAATMLIAMDENEAALKFIKQASALANKLYEKDTDAGDPNKGIKPFWPSAAVWRTSILAARKISPQAALEIVKDVSDPEIQLFERISLANAWLGVSGGTRIIVEKGKSRWDNNFMNDLEE
jgi:hypothetical protein